MKPIYIILFILLIHPVSARDINIGYAKDSTNITDMENEYKVNFTHQLIYQKINTLDFKKVANVLDTGNDCIINIEFMNDASDEGNLDDIRYGKYDKQLIKFMKDAKNDGRHFTIRTLHEFNGDWYPWSIYRQNNSVESFKGAWSHVCYIIDNSGANVSIQLNYNCKSVKETYSFNDMYPGDFYVDKVVVTCYNRAGTDQYHTDWKTFNENFDKPYNDITSFTLKPIGIAEVSTTSYNGCKPYWIIQTCQTINNKYTKVDEVTWFLNNKVVDNRIWDWDMNSRMDRICFMYANNYIIH